MRKAIYIALLALPFGISSCDKVDDPYLVKPVDPSQCPVPTFPQNTNTRRNILLEEFTGHLCGNCPGAGLYANSTLKGQLQDTLITVALHAGTLAIPEPPPSHYDTEYRTDASETYYNYTDFGFFYVPAALINRVSYGGSPAIDQSDWMNAIAVERQKPLEANLQMINDFDTTTGKACIHIETEFLANLTGNFNLIVYVVEDSILDWQKNYLGTGDPNYPSPETDSYWHRHVLRDNVNGTWGSSVVAGSATSGQKVVSSFQYTVDPSWNKKHLYLVAYIYNDATKEILQAIEEHLE